jgi:hypothetical protein
MDKRIWNAISAGVDRRTQEQNKFKAAISKLKLALVPEVLSVIENSVFNSRKEIHICWPHGFDPFDQGIFLVYADLRGAIDEEFPDLLFIREEATGFPGRMLQVYTWIKE